MVIVNNGYMGLIVNLAPNYGTQIGAVGVGGAAASGLIINFGLNAGTQIGALFM